MKIGALYKYLKREHAIAMLDAGRVRIGTLHDFRRAELGNAIGDAEEGVARTSHDISERIDVTRAENRSWVMDRVIGVLPGAEGAFVEGLTLVVNDNVENCYLYCASYEFSARCMREFAADACVEIADVRGFVDVLTEALRTRRLVRGGRIEPCTYATRDRDVTMARVAPAFLKPPRYAYQKEIRFAFTPTTTQEISPLVIDLPEIRRYCRLRKI